MQYIDSNNLQSFRSKLILNISSRNGFCQTTENNSPVWIKHTNDLQISDDEKNNSIENENRYEQDPMVTDTVVIENSTKTEFIKSVTFSFVKSQRKTVTIMK